MSGASTGWTMTGLWRRMVLGLKGFFSWPHEPTFSNEIDAAAALFGQQSDADAESGLRSTPNGTPG